MAQLVVFTRAPGAFRQLALTAHEKRAENGEPGDGTTLPMGRGRCCPPVSLDFSLEALCTFVLGVAIGALGMPIARLVRASLWGARPEGRSTTRVAALAGMVARVTTAIPGDGVGRVVARRAGARLVLPARAHDAIAIDAGAAVVVIAIERGVAWVTPFDLSTFDVSSVALEREASRSESEVPWIR